MKQETLHWSKTERNKNSISSYDKFKEFEGRKYTGVKVGRSHKWYYDKGEWKVKKITPDQWDLKFSVDKKNELDRLLNGLVFQSGQSITGIYLPTKM